MYFFKAITYGKLDLTDILAGCEALIELIYDSDLKTQLLNFTDEDFPAECLTSNKSVCDSNRRKEMFYLMTHSTHFIYGYMASDIW